MVVVHFFVASKVARYKAFNRAVSLGNIAPCSIRQTALSAFSYQIHPFIQRTSWGTFVSHNETSMCSEFLSPINGVEKNLFTIIIMDYKTADEKLPRNYAFTNKQATRRIIYHLTVRISLTIRRGMVKMWGVSLLEDTQRCLIGKNQRFEVLLRNHSGVLKLQVLR